MNDKIRLTVLIERFKSHLAKYFDKTSQEIDEILQDFLVKHDISDINHKEIKELNKENHQLFLMALAGFTTKLKDEWHEFYNLQADFEVKFAKKHLVALPHTQKKELAQAIKQISYSQALLDRPQPLLKGVSLNELLGKFSKDEADRLTAMIRLAHHEGWTNHRLIQAIRGTRAGKFKDGILQTTRRHAETLARTGTAIMAGEAQKEFAEQNRDLVKGVQIIAVLDRRTSPKCRSLDKKIMPLDKAVYPPYHFNCRSRTILVYKGVKEPAKRTSEHGVTDSISYYEWLKTQSPAFQDEALGKARGKLFREGGLSPERFSALQLDRNFEPLTLDEMRRLEPLVFKKVFDSP